MKAWIWRARSWYSRLPWEHRCLAGAALLSLIPLLGFTLRPATAVTEAKRDPVAAMDTYIPKGFVLVPIEVENFEALDSILGRFGIVDLLQASASPDVPARLVARNVRLLRAPHNPSHFAILIPERETDRVLRFGGTFSVVIKRPGQNGTEFVSSVKAKRRTITYDGGS